MRRLVTATLGLALLLVFQGCDIIERVEPSTSVSQQTAISTEDGARAIRAAMYERLHGCDSGGDDIGPALSTDWLLGPSSLADNTFVRAGANRHELLNLNDFEAGIGTVARSCAFDGINDANLLINGLTEEAVPEETAARLEAEGRFMRALYMHHMVRIFGYDPAGPESSDGLMQPASGPGSDFDLGIVIRTEPTLSTADATDKPRATVHEVYDQIVGDLTTAISLFQGLPSDAKVNSPAFATEPAAHALLARVHLYQKNYQAAEDQAQTAIDQAGTRFGADLATEDELVSMWDEGTGLNPEGIFISTTDPTTESPGVNNAISAYTSTQWTAQIPTNELINLYDSTDARLEDWYRPCFDEARGNDFTGECVQINDEGFELRKYASETNTQFADNHVHLRVAEMKLIQAEARLEEASGNPAEPLNELRSNRGLDGDLASGDVTMQRILNERRRELVAEGHRWFDMKRLGGVVEGGNRVMSKSAGSLTTPPQDPVPFSSPGVLDEISDTEIANNDSLQQNPGF